MRIARRVGVCYFACLTLPATLRVPALTFAGYSTLCPVTAHRTCCPTGVVTFAALPRAASYATSAIPFNKFPDIMPRLHALPTTPPLFSACLPLYHWPRLHACLPPAALPPTFAPARAPTSVLRAVVVARLGVGCLLFDSRYGGGTATGQTP